MFANYYQGRRVLVTGHTGFKGSWLSLWLAGLGGEVWGVGLEPVGRMSLYSALSPECFKGQWCCDIRDFAKLKEIFAQVRPEVVFHLAAQSLVRKSYHDPLDTLSCNVTGTAHVLEAVRDNGLACTTVVVSSDKCYENREWEFGYRENDRLGGHDVYSMSKAATEFVTHSWNRSFFKNDPALGPLVTVRAGNVIGGGDGSPDRLVPDCMHALLEARPVVVRNPDSTRPWQHVLEPLSGYLWLAARLAEDGKDSPVDSAFNFGPDPCALQPVRKLVAEVLSHWPGEWRELDECGQMHEAKALNLSIDKAVSLLGWRPVWSFQQAVHATVAWYQFHACCHEAGQVEKFSRGQIRKYTDDAREKGVPWTQ